MPTDDINQPSHFEQEHPFFLEPPPDPSPAVRLGVYVGRFCPLHLGHCRVLDFMLSECGVTHSLAVIGSSNHPISYRHLFPCRDRREFLRAVYPGLTVGAIPDYPSDLDWLEDLWSIIGMWKCPFTPQNVTFYGGCEEDILFFVKAGYRTQILNRFDGSGPKCSATEVRDALVHERSLTGLLHPSLELAVRERFTLRWEELKRC